jgi:5-methylcytosine-specific restriction endonuclease McrBC GTP-binding regulatory subunit McrB
MYHELDYSTRSIIKEGKADAAAQRAEDQKRYEAQRLEDQKRYEVQRAEDKKNHEEQMKELKAFIAQMLQQNKNS